MRGQYFGVVDQYGKFCNVGDMALRLGSTGLEGKLGSNRDG